MNLDKYFIQNRWQQPEVELVIDKKHRPHIKMLWVDYNRRFKQTPVTNHEVLTEARKSIPLAGLSPIDLVNILDK